MPYNLTEDEQTAIMDAVGNVLNVWLEESENPITFECENGDIKEIPSCRKVISANAPEEIKNLDKVYMEIVSVGFTVGGSFAGGQ